MSCGQENRLERRILAKGVYAKINGQRFEVIDWSIRGLAVVGYERPHERGEVLNVQVDFEAMHLFSTGFYVTRHDPTTSVLAGVFVQYQPEDAVKIDQIFESLETLGEGAPP